MVKYHRNSQRRFITNNLTYFITTKAKDKYPFFKNEILCELFIEELMLAKEIKKFELYAFNILYDHVHLLIKPENEVENISRIMQFIKRHFSRNANYILGYELKNTYGLDSNINEGDNGLCRLHDDQTLSLNKLISNAQLLKLKIGNIKMPKFQWQTSYHDHYIRNLKDYQHHYDYIVTNHFKHDLPINWKYHSEHYPDIIDPYE